ncbi:DUF308 domain-containing protein [Stakelama sp. CBK3Z-3]|uniref:DUF308 domain-containing protein n=1 Tax=Stakelama flava TaxID=2860338 RepID=A0ABS6XR31_9SPHN|nr:DUF308 domain-containing protein [Stakelama flava]MBW4332344.1 DUF308 domain-containing protein [Stakelama flava]
MTRLATSAPAAAPASSNWLKRYYSMRAAVSILWVALAFTIGKSQPAIATVLLIAYPLWDSIANYIDAMHSGGLRVNPTQFLNTVVSGVVTAAVIVTIQHDFHTAIGVIGVWAALSGLLQLSTAVRRWRKVSAQWPQILSGVQSAAAGAHFIIQAAAPSQPLSVAIVAPYAAFGAVYFAISAGVLAFKR